ncbi:hypothetical protein A359_00490 [secondary endosymbiont of Ctenarytaina eucalypti]|uniref:Uncharacterized protein n=1 Tax=secondary endosymbiont of Ctenarytaina eucalypti TaxID=1199245 RepID=J3VR88_9ENTR|nr:hypothetical protein A359_00490 [secondary endosymbiont of Ctenarytaina eucalypti]
MQKIILVSFGSKWGDIYSYLCRLIVQQIDVCLGVMFLINYNAPAIRKAMTDND